MFTVFVWVIVASIFVGAAKGILEGSGKELGDSPVTWLVTASLYGALIFSESVDPAEAAQREANKEHRSTLAAGMAACDDRVKSNATVPNSVDFHLLDTSRNMRGNTAHIYRGFTAKNAFGTEIEYAYQCQYRRGQIVALSISK